MKSFLLGFALISIMFITACGGNKKAETSETVSTEVVEIVDTATVDTVVVANETIETEVK